MLEKIWNTEKREISSTDFYHPSEVASILFSFTYFILRVLKSVFLNLMYALHIFMSAFIEKKAGKHFFSLTLSPTALYCLALNNSV